MLALPVKCDGETLKEERVFILVGYTHYEVFDFSSTTLLNVSGFSSIRSHQPPNAQLLYCVEASNTQVPGVAGSPPSQGFVAECLWLRHLPRNTYSWRLISCVFQRARFHQVLLVWDRREFSVTSEPSSCPLQKGLDVSLGSWKKRASFWG